LFLLSCHAAITDTEPSAQQPQTRLRRADSEPCGFNDKNLKEKGGKIGLPAFVGTGQFGGILHYAASNYGGAVGLVACDGTYNQNNVPVPQGFTADWFCEFHFAQTTVQFGPGNLVGTVTSNTLLHNQNYYLYAYDGQNNLIASYGPFLNDHKTLHFTSPFENGFTMVGPMINLEIAHPSQ
jgi:hypothetical protein